MFVYLLEIRLQISLDQQNSQGSAFRTVLMIMMVLMMWEPSFFITRLSPEVMQLVLFFSLKIIIIRFTAQQNHSPKRKYSNLGCLNARTHTHARTHARTYVRTHARTYACALTRAHTYYELSNLVQCNTGKALDRLLLQMTQLNFTNR